MHICQIILEDSRYKNNSNFNPSIVYLNDDKYLVCFHSFRRYSGEGENHPWAEPWWEPQPGGFWGTGFLILDIDSEGRASVDHVFEDQNNGIDMRLAMTNEGILATFNLDVSESEMKTLFLGEDRPKSGLSSTDGASLYSVIRGVFIGIKNNQLVNANLPGYILCPNLSSDSEKNWSVWSYRKKIYLSYSLTPKHTVFWGLSDFSLCWAKTEPSVNIMRAIERYYRNDAKFSLSTPAIKKGQEMIGVGHFKCFIDMLPENSPVDLFIKKHQKYPVHPYQVIYLMFLYTFDPQNYCITKLSNAFLPPESSSLVVYPCGLTFSPYRDYIISYGESDSMMKLLLIPEREIDTYLRNIEEIVPSNYLAISL